jgi:hypothetical protein
LAMYPSKPAPRIISRSPIFSGRSSTTSTLTL